MLFYHVLSQFLNDPALVPSVSAAEIVSRHAAVLELNMKRLYPTDGVATLNANAARDDLLARLAQHGFLAHLHPSLAPEFDTFVAHHFQRVLGRVRADRTESGDPSVVKQNSSEHSTSLGTYPRGVYAVLNAFKARHCSMTLREREMLSRFTGLSANQLVNHFQNSRRSLKGSVEQQQSDGTRQSHDPEDQERDQLVLHNDQLMTNHQEDVPMSSLVHQDTDPLPLGLIIPETDPCMALAQGDNEPGNEPVLFGTWPKWAPSAHTITNATSCSRSSSATWSPPSATWFGLPFSYIGDSSQCTSSLSSLTSSVASPLSCLAPSTVALDHSLELDTTAPTIYAPATGFSAFPSTPETLGDHLGPLPYWRPDHTLLPMPSLAKPWVHYDEFQSILPDLLASPVVLDNIPDPLVLQSSVAASFDAARTGALSAPVVPQADLTVPDLSQSGEQLLNPHGSVDLTVLPSSASNPVYSIPGLVETAPFGGRPF